MTIEFILRVFIAAVLGGLIGFEREYRAKEAGVRTHFLVAMGSALFMILSQFGFDSQLGTSSVSLDPSRIASQVVTGIGFIGAGTIIFQKHVVKGLTTAAGLWVTSAIGLTCGSGMYLLAAAATLLVLICLETIYFMLMRFGSRSLSVTLRATNRQVVGTIIDELNSDGAAVDSCEMKEEKGKLLVSLELRVKRGNYQRHVHDFMLRFEGVDVMSIE